MKDQQQPQGEQAVIFSLPAVNRIAELALDAPTKFGANILEVLKTGKPVTLGNDKPAEPPKDGGAPNSGASNDSSTGCDAAAT